MNQQSPFDEHEDLNSPVEPLPDDSDFDLSATTQELTAYLDGELEPAEVARVERRLSEDSDYRAELQSLQRTWDAFDLLPREHGDAAFVRTTMEMVVADAKQATSSRVRRKSTWLRGLILVAVPLAMLLASFALARSFQLQPHRQLVENLALIKNLERYQTVNCDVDFLEKLNQRNLFMGDGLFENEYDDLEQIVSKFGAPLKTINGETEAPEDYLASLSHSQLQQLKRNHANFTQLTPAEAERLIQFHEQLLIHPERSQLRKVLEAYYNWLISLGATEKAKLLDLTPEQRLGEIAKIRFQQSKSALGRLGATRLPLDRDEDHLLTWFDLTIRSQEKLLRQQFPPIMAEYQKQQDAAAPLSLDELQRFSTQAPIKQLVAILIRVDRHFVADLIFQDVDVLRPGLSFEAQTILADQEPEDQKDLVMNWIQATIQSKAAIPDGKLQEFYEQLPPEKRDQLDRMSLEDWTSTLSRMYRERNALIRIDDLDDIFLEDF